MKTILITGTLKVETGLHIGAGKDTIEIGGIDNPVIKNPITEEPYIPGSSLKGKMRSLMEWKTGKVLENEGKPCRCGRCDICKVFGSPADRSDTNMTHRPTRLIVRDSILTEESRDRLEKRYTEDKAENNIDRITAKATPRHLERIVPGSEFGLELVFKSYNDDDEKLIDAIVLPALRLLELDYLGGGGSRGNGKVLFKGLKVGGEAIDLAGVQL